VWSPLLRAAFAEQKLGLCLRLDTFGDHLKPILCAITINERTIAAASVSSMILRTKL
jgi:hypothetical protein